MQKKDIYKHLSKLLLHKKTILKLKPMVFKWFTSTGSIQLKLCPDLLVCASSAAELTFYVKNISFQLN